MKRSRRTAPWVFASVSALALALCTPVAVFAQEGGGVAGGPGPIGTADLAGTTLDAIDITVEGATDSAAADALAQRARSALGLSEGSALDAFQLERGIDNIRALGGVAEVDWRLDRAVAPQVNRLAITITAGEATAAAPAAKFPVLHRGERSYLRLLISGGVGAFSDGQPWFGDPGTFTRNNPLVQVPAIGADTGNRATWTEAFAELGIGGVAPIGDSDFYVYGAASAIAVAATGRDIFRDDSRATFDEEDLYAGLLYAPKEGTRVNLSVGRQNFSLNEGFLISQFGSQYNAGPRPGVYLAPRTSQDMSVLLTIKGKKLTSTSYYLDPNEFEPIESNTRIAGTNLRYNFTKSASIDVSYINIVNSDGRVAVPDGSTRDREGIQTVSIHGRWSDAEAVPGLWLDGEIAHQWHKDYAMNAWAGYGLVGYLARDLPWTPSISYRFSSHSGDDPDTERFERFDPLFTGGLGEWLQGISINKVLNAGNRQAHRIRTNVAPNPKLNLTLDLFFLRANELNNRGGNRALTDLVSRDLGREVQFAARWSISPRVYFLGILAHAEPGDAIRAVTADEARPWTTIQAQFFFNF
ncbi:MAG: alginate export family protein [Erythrobacter sp.]|nr:alginate export family protein [Erythrobacter sp.]